MSRKNLRLDLVVNIALLIACALIVGGYIQSHLGKSATVKELEKVSSRRDGEQLPISPAALGEGSSKVVSLALAPSCDACNASLPFYRDLLEHRDLHSPSTRIIALVAHDDLIAPLSERFLDASISVDGIFAVDFRALKIPLVPALFITDGQGVVERSWLGVLENPSRQQILETL